MLVKAYLHKGGQLTEIRRFEVIEVYGKSLYELLLKELQVVFQTERWVYNLCYKDNDGDPVALTSQKELEHGLKFLRNDTFCIQVNLLREDTFWWLKYSNPNCTRRANC